MAKRIPKDLDIAAGFFSGSPGVKPELQNIEEDKIEPAIETSSNKKVAPKRRGRPKKDTLKNKNFTLTMNPILYEKIRILAEEHTRGNISAFIEAAIIEYCKLNEIKLDEIQVESDVLEEYKRLQNK